MTIVKVSITTFITAVIVLTLLFVGFVGYEMIFANNAPTYSTTTAVPLSIHTDPNPLIVPSGAVAGAWVDEEWNAVQYFVTERINPAAGVFDLIYTKLDAQDPSVVGAAISLINANFGIDVAGDVVVTGWSLNGHVHFQ